MCVVGRWQWCLRWSSLNTIMDIVLSVECKARKGLWFNKTYPSLHQVADTQGTLCLNTVTIYILGDYCCNTVLHNTSHVTTMQNNQGDASTLILRRETQPGVKGVLHQRPSQLALPRPDLEVTQHYKSILRMNLRHNPVSW